MISKIIHYCWFGRGEKPQIVKECIKSWSENLKGYKIIQWNEENFDINSNKFVKEAYENGKYAFVSDYVRVFALYNYGGIYMDTDVELLKNFDNYLDNESFWGFEAGNYIATSTIGAEKGSFIIKKFLDSYEGKNFLNENGEFNVTTNVKIVSEIFKELGVELNGIYQKINGLGAIYPMNIFSPYDYRYYEISKSSETVAIHHYYKSWLPAKERTKQFFKKNFIKVIGSKKYKKLLRQ